MRNPWLCILIVMTLGLVSLAGLGGIILLSYSGKAVPESLVAIVSGSAGSLASFLVLPPRGSVGTGSGPGGG